MDEKGCRMVSSNVCKVGEKPGEYFRGVRLIVGLAVSSAQPSRSVPVNRGVSRRERKQYCGFAGGDGGAAGTSSAFLKEMQWLCCWWLVRALNAPWLGDGASLGLPVGLEVWRK